jgi:hypothetical protein
MLFFSLIVLFYGVGGVVVGVADAFGIGVAWRISSYSIHDQDGKWLVTHETGLMSERILAIRLGPGEIPSSLAFPGGFPQLAPDPLVPRFASGAIEADADVGTMRTVVAAGWPLRFVWGSVEEVFEGEPDFMTPRLLRSQRGAVVIPPLRQLFLGRTGLVPVAPNFVNLVLASAVTSVIVLGIQLGVVIGVRALRDRFVLKAGCCVQCRHRLAPGQARCPECGREVSPRADPPSGSGV